MFPNIQYLFAAVVVSELYENLATFVQIHVS